MEGNIKGDYLRLNAKAVSRGQNEFISEFKMAVGDVNSIRGAGYGVHVHSSRI